MERRACGWGVGISGPRASKKGGELSAGKGGNEVGGGESEKEVKDSPGSSLRAKEGARGVDLDRPAPLLGRHVQRMRAAHDAREAAQDVHAAVKQRGHLGDGGLHALLATDVAVARHDPRRGEVGAEGGDGVARVRGADVEQREPGEPVFEQGAGAGEGEVASAAGDCGTWSGEEGRQGGAGLVRGLARRGHTDRIALDGEPR